MEDIVFLYDQVAESIARLHTFASARGDELGDGHGDVEDDVNALTVLLARRDLLVLAASTRNFVETARATQSARDLKIQTSEIFISAGPPFCRDKKTSITVYQCLSRILHAHHLRIYRCASDYFMTVSADSNDFWHRSRNYEKEGGDCHAHTEPLSEWSQSEKG
jgi:hypothetical protein